MFDEKRSPRVAPPTPAEIAADTLLLAALAGVARVENQHAFHKVNTATEFHRRGTRRRPGLPERPATAWSHAAHTEIALHLACSATTAASTSRSVPRCASGCPAPAPHSPPATSTTPRPRASPPPPPGSA